MGYVNILVFTEDLWFLSGMTTVLLQDLTGMILEIIDVIFDRLDSCF